MDQQFGGSWTDQKMRIVVDYARAYLTIMATLPWVKTIYFDGFAGSGVIKGEDGEAVKKGTALQILEITSPKPFDLYYFVELNEAHKCTLENQIKENHPGRKAYVIKDDCNNKLKALADYLTKNRTYRALSFIDPYGMDVKWSSIEALKGLGVDLWILVPTGVGANRLLKVDGNISDGWYKALETCLGLNRAEIDKRFYRRTTTHTLFGAETTVTKEKETVQKLGDLYAERLGEVFKYVSEPFLLKNSMNSIMYHFMMATNNAAGVKIANDVIKPKYEA
ncbi:three-Cys-motif partner protein TcmP [Paracnuella aquatica]|uniref:three-Cys-motif partner protein TcmP n=1 Tax=Paracnuella aquatica TaxID=2268757 RepID=UPI00138FCCBC|nr:three-Cys-motif partner protein TcmP [Paracnuella aquatica]